MLVLFVGGGIFLAGLGVGYAVGRSSGRRDAFDSQLGETLLRLENFLQKRGEIDRLSGRRQAPAPRVDTILPEEQTPPPVTETSRTTARLDEEAPLPLSQRPWMRKETPLPSQKEAVTSPPPSSPEPVQELVAEPAMAMEATTPSNVPIPDESPVLHTEAAESETPVSKPLASEEEAPKREPWNISWDHFNKVAKFLGMDNVWVLSGVAILFLGLVFLVRLAADQGFFTPPLRLAAAALVGTGLLAFGWYLRERRRDLALILQGGGVGALYLTVVAAVQIYPILPNLAAFVILVCLVVFSTFLAIAQNAQIMAHVAKSAGFLAPILVSSGSNNYIGLFSYYIILNLGIVAVSRFRQWRKLHLTGFVFTALIGGLWGSSGYDQATMFPIVEAFLLVFFVLFTYLALAGSAVFQSARLQLFANSKPEAVVDLPLTLATPLVFFLYQAYLAYEIPFVLAFTALGLGAFYLWVAATLWKRRSQIPQLEENASKLTLLATKAYGLQAEIYLAFGIVCANLALPLALFDLEIPDLRGRLLGIAWCLEGAALYWLGRRNDILLFRIFGGIGFFLAAVFQLKALGGNQMPFSGSYGALGIVMLLHLLGAAAFASVSLACHRFPGKGIAIEVENDRNLSWAFLGLAALWLYGSWLNEVIPFDYPAEIMLAGSMVVTAGCLFAARRLDWPALNAMPLLNYLPLVFLFVPCVPVSFAILLNSRFAYELTFDLGLGHFYNFGEHPPVGAILIILFVLFESALLFCERKNQTNRVSQVRVAILPTLALPSSILLMAWAVNSVLNGFNITGMHPLYPPMTLLFPVLIVWSLPFLAGFTPLSDETRMKRILAEGALPLRLWLWASALPVTAVVLWILTHVFTLGMPLLPVYLPLLNTVELGLVATLFVLFHWGKIALPALSEERSRCVTRPEIWCAIGLVLITISLARACAFWTGMEFSLDGAFHDPIFQAVLALFWGVTGIAAMLLGNKKGWRLLWLAGMSLMLLDIAKLFFIDLTRMETIWRIVSFMGVGLLLILVGGYAPLPTARKKTQEETPLEEKIEPEIKEEKEE